MTTIFSVVDASIQSAQRDDSRPPAQDFAHELAKHESQAKPPMQNQAKATAGGGFEEPQTLQHVGTSPATTMDELPLQTDVPVVLLQQAEVTEHVTVAPTGVTEALLGARVFGWHAMAQAYLSELTAADEHAAHPGEQQIDQALTNTQAEAVGEPQTTNVIVPAAMAEASVTAPQVDTLMKVQQFVTLDDAAPANAIELAAADTAASGFWPERSLRFTRQRDGSSVAWLRDFRLSNAEASHLIRIVLSDAREKGVALRRIMLNGREVWTSPNVI